MTAGVPRNGRVRNRLLRPPIPSGESPLGTGGSPVPPTVWAAATSEFGFNTRPKRDHEPLTRQTPPAGPATKASGKPRTSMTTRPNDAIIGTGHRAVALADSLKDRLLEKGFAPHETRGRRNLLSSRRSRSLNVTSRPRKRPGTTPSKPRRRPRTWRSSRPAASATWSSPPSPGIVPKVPTPCPSVPDSTAAANAVTRLRRRPQHPPPLTPGAAPPPPRPRPPLAA